MRFSAYCIALWFCLGLDGGLADAFQLGSIDVAPSFTVVLLTFICLWATHRSALTAALLTGVCMDLLNDVPTSYAGATYIVGPHALGCTLAAQLVLTIRALIFRRTNVVTLALLTAASAMLISIAAIAVISIRSMLDIDIVYTRPVTNLVPALLSALYTATLALIMGFVLNTFRPLFGFRPPSAAYISGGSANIRR